MHTLKMKKKTYLGMGKCIFCMNTFDNSDLTDEHIIPEAIHGALVMKKAACIECARKTNKNYENHALEYDLKLPRLLFELKGKGKNGISNDVRHLPPVYQGNTTTFGEERRILNFPVELYPKVFSLIKFLPPGILSNVDRGGALTNPIFQWFNVGGSGLTNVTVEQKTQNGPFAKMIAKIGYCFAVAEKGLNGFKGEEIRSLLKGERLDIYNFVGCSAHDENLSKEHLHSLYLRERNGLLTVLVHLFASLSTGKGAAPYEVVIGELDK